MTRCLSMPTQTSMWWNCWAGPTRNIQISKRQQQQQQKLGKQSLLWLNLCPGITFARTPLNASARRHWNSWNGKRVVCVFLLQLINLTEIYMPNYVLHKTNELSQTWYANISTEQIAIRFIRSVPITITMSIKKQQCEAQKKHTRRLNIAECT